MRDQIAIVRLTDGKIDIMPSAVDEDPLLHLYHLKDPIIDVTLMIRTVIMIVEANAVVVDNMVTGHRIITVIIVTITIQTVEM